MTTSATLAARTLVTSNVGASNSRPAVRRTPQDDASLGVIARARRRYRKIAVRSSREEAFQRVLSGDLYPASRSATRWPPNLWADRSGATRESGFLARPPIADYWSAGCTPRSRCDFGSTHRPESLRQAAGSPDRSRSAREGRPTRYRPAQSPLSVDQNAARSGRNEFVIRSSELCADPIHGLGDLVRRMPGKVLLQRVTEELASGPLGTPRQLFCELKYLVWDRYCSFHTKSITSPIWGVNAASGAGSPRIGTRCVSSAPILQKKGKGTMAGNTQCR